MHDDEPRYLRRQKPVEIRRKKFGGQAAPRFIVARSYLELSPTAADHCGGLGRRLSAVIRRKSPLLKPDQIELTGNHIVSRDAVLQQFARDRGHSVLRIPLDARRSALEELSWVETASVQRILPNRIRVEITERTPIAFLRNGTELALDRCARRHSRSAPRRRLTISPSSPAFPTARLANERDRRMQTYQEFLKDIDLVRSGSSDRVSEIDLRNRKRSARGDDRLRVARTIRRRSPSTSATAISPASIAWSWTISRSGRPTTAACAPSICSIHGR